ncbi:copper amine oxidase N-terminal domain-containing protein [Paenibacillus sp. HB172176]|uniref:copper amine oxidase N-terminal domain-containing protein n=1 Tax=Paenibacillus sp. HB172176 TaxID=2493690 RepID=UPI00143CBB9C|nr:copper amine oxidase N-terminal domain-containing protein [Paenibacillus sp. HB172176]
MKKRKYIAATAVTVALIAGGIGAQPVSAKSAERLPVVITANGFDEPIAFEHAPFLVDGSVFLPIRETAGLMDSSVTWIPEGRRVVVNSPTTRIEMSFGSTAATVNGEAYTIPAMPINVNGTLYVPVRFVTEALGAKVSWNGTEQRVDLSFDQPYLYAVSGDKSFWLKREDGELYLSENADEAELVADTNAEITDIGEFTAEAMSKDNVLLEAHDNFGEPHINDNVFKMVVANDQLTLETKVHYWGMHPLQSTDWSEDGNALLMNGAELLEISSTGETLETYDLGELTGYEDAAFQVEYGDEDILVVRPQMAGWLTLIDKKTKTAVRLADALLDNKKLEIIESLDPLSVEFVNWDGLKLVSRDGDTLKLTHHWFIDNSDTELSYELSVD